ncbi:AraC family transcriptional regulator ligand-binding domain-containing protein [Hoyosella sp. G463]|uniref:AraC family transcriptional regulator ligand-binding domain-containing protein n=1 Tax=Lolliginicoccus lacisalsi TaxID=2742202 RepID=A0A927JBY7_9ACTN|nr:AraC family transcriptional regulator [Lolliginicoccus lacisalsi]MBD8505847.1 AraC family transcriptional regulator ligand-binding domain-containing protein [Lolliginicoccus lacisalsi]
MPHRIPTEYVRRTVHAADTRGIDLRPALDAARIPRGVLEASGPAVKPSEASAFTRAVWALTNDELGGLGAAPVPRGTFRLVTLALIHSPDLGHALARMISSLPALPAMTPITFSIDTTTGAVTLDLRGHRPDEATQLLIELAFLLIHRFAAWLIDHPLAPVRVALPYPARDDYAPTFYRALFGVTPTLGAPTAAIVFEPRALHAPIVQTEHTLLEFLRTAPARLFTAPAGNTPRTTQVLRMLQRSPLHALPSNAQIATRLALSESHLRRLLNREGTSAGRIRDEVLREAAIARLRRGESIDQIATALGFSEPSAFRRAFRRWTGATPRAFQPATPDAPSP